MEEIKKAPGEWEPEETTYKEGDQVTYDGQEYVCKGHYTHNNRKKAPSFRNILFWGLNGFFVFGLLFFAVIFWLRGDTFHAIIDILYLLIIVECLFLRRKHTRLQQEHNTLSESHRVLIKQYKDMEETLRDINDPFRENREITINESHVRMETLTSHIKYERMFVVECSSEEREKRYKLVEKEARRHLMDEIINTELITVKHITDDAGMRRCVAEIIVGVKTDKKIEEIIHPNNEI